MSSLGETGASQVMGGGEQMGNAPFQLCLNYAFRHLGDLPAQWEGHAIGILRLYPGLNSAAK